MRAIAIDFAPRKFRPSRLAIGIAALGVVLMGMSGWETWQAIQHRTALKEQLQERRVHQPAPPNPLPTRPRLSEKEIAAINRAILQLNLPWEELFATFDADKYQATALLSLAPNPQSRQLRLQAEAKTVDDMAQFVHTLQAEEAFSKVVLTRHEVNAQDPNRPIRFAVDASWRTP